MSKKEEILHKLNTEDRNYIKEKFKEKDAKIADLEAKLEESKEQCRECKHLNKKIELNIKNKLMAEIQELKQQLAEKDDRIALLKKSNISLADDLSKLQKYVTDLQKDLEESKHQCITIMAKKDLLELNQAEERKKVLWEIRKRAKRTQIYIKPTEKSPTGKEKCFVYEVSDDFLDQIERETDD